MTDLQDRINQEFENLRTLRDELRVKIELGKAEVRDKWEELEGDWQHVEGKIRVLGEETRESAKEVGEATEILVGELRDAYRRLRDLL
jgi:predicted  nucleic acid-binding Zn-ribbon protein